jgi:Protein of unknown function (DUF1583)/Glycosyltransferase family 87
MTQALPARDLSVWQSFRKTLQEQSTACLWILFLASRIAILAFLAGRLSDLNVHQAFAAHILAGDVPFRDFTPEYPPLTLLFSCIPALLDPSLIWYVPLFRALCFAVDCGIWLALLKINSKRPAQNVLYVLCGTALGSLIYDRIDMILGGLLLWALIALVHGRQRVFELVAGTAVAFKLIPIIWVPLVAAAQWRKSRRELLAAVFLLALPTLLSIGLVLLLGGHHLDRLFAYHLGRGIQIESVPASFEMILLAFGMPGAVSYEFACANLHTPYEKALATSCTLLLIATVLWSAMIVVRQKPSPERLTLVLCGALLVAIVCSKVLSPQFLVFLLPLLVTLPPLQTKAAAIGNWLLMLAVYGFSGWIFPWQYDNLVFLEPDAQLLMLMRNEMLLVLAVSQYIRACLPVGCQVSLVGIGFASGLLFLAVLGLTLMPLTANHVDQGQGLVGAIYHDFRVEGMPGAFTVDNDPYSELIHADRGGLRITLPKIRDQYRPTSVNVPVYLQGDFEVTTGFEIIEAEQPDTGFGVGILLTMTGAPRAGSFRIGRMTRPYDQQLLLWDRWKKEADEMKEVEENVTASTAKTGRLRLTRTGPIVHYLWSPQTTGDDFQELGESNVGADAIRQIRLTTETGEQPCQLDVRFVDLRIRGQGITAGLPQPPKVSREWLWLWAAGLSLPLICCLAVLRSVRQQQRHGKIPADIAVSQPPRK